MPKHRQGGKLTAAHTTIIDAAEAVVDCAQRLPKVSKIALGIIESIHSRHRRIQFRELPGGWELKIYGNTSLQTIYIYTSDKTQTRSDLYQAFHGH